MRADFMGIESCIKKLREDPAREEIYKRAVRNLKAEIYRAGPRRIHMVPWRIENAKRRGGPLLAYEMRG